MGLEHLQEGPARCAPRKVLSTARARTPAARTDRAHDELAAAASRTHVVEVHGVALIRPGRRLPTPVRLEDEDHAQLAVKPKPRFTRLLVEGSS